jgi:hypothetical protein
MGDGGRAVARGAHLFGDARPAEDVVSGRLRLGYQAKRREEGSESKSAGSNSTAARDEPRLYDFASSREFGEKVEVVRDHLQ